MELTPIIQEIMTSPTPAALWRLYAQLLAAGTPTDAPAMRTAEAFHHYLSDLQSKATARQYSQLASLLDIGAVGGIALQNLSSGEARHLVRRWLLGTASESLMVLASRQYIKGWGSELRALHRKAAWFLSRELWSLSAEMQPESPAGERWVRIQQLVGPALDPDTPSATAAVLLGHLFQLLLLSQLAPLLPTQAQ